MMTTLIDRIAEGTTTREDAEKVRELAKAAEEARDELYVREGPADKLVRALDTAIAAVEE